MPKKVVIIGGGISGLAAAHRLQELTAPEDIEISVLEAGDRWGGVIETALSQWGGSIIEKGPESFVSDKPWATQLCQRLGIDIIGTNPTKRRSFIYKNGKLMPIPTGFYLLAPTNLFSFVFSQLLSIPGRLRVLLDLVIPRRPEGEDESLADFVRRRLGSEALEAIAQPMAGGIYTADPEKLSMKAALPRFLEMEKQHGSLIRALKIKAKEKNAESFASGPRYSLFLSLRQGMQDLINRLVEKLKLAQLFLNSSVETVESGKGQWRISVVGGRQFNADFLVFAIPAFQAARLTEPFSPVIAEALKAIPYESVATVNVLYDEKDLPRPLEGFGFVVPADQKRKIVACTFTSVKFPNRAPKGKALLRAFVGGAMGKGYLELNDEGLRKIVLEEFESILGIKAAPESVTVKRYDRSMPQYHVGHLDRVSLIEQEAKKFPGLYFIGNAYRGIGIPDCIFHAERAAEEIARQLYTD